MATSIVQVEVERRLNRIQKQNEEAAFREWVEQVVFRVISGFKWHKSFSIFNDTKLLIKIWEVDVFFEGSKDALVSEHGFPEACSAAFVQLLLQI